MHSGEDEPKSGGVPAAGVQVGGELLSARLEPFAVVGSAAGEAVAVIGSWRARRLAVTLLPLGALDFLLSASCKV